MGVRAPPSKAPSCCEVCCCGATLPEVGETMTCWGDDGGHRERSGRLPHAGAGAAPAGAAELPSASSPTATTPRARAQLSVPSSPRRPWSSSTGVSSPLARVVLASLISRGRRGVRGVASAWSSSKSSYRSRMGSRRSVAPGVLGTLAVAVTEDGRLPPPPCSCGLMGWSARLPPDCGSASASLVRGEGLQPRRGGAPAAAAAIAATPALESRAAWHARRTAFTMACSSGEAQASAASEPGAARRTEGRAPGSVASTTLGEPWSWTQGPHGHMARSRAFSSAITGTRAHRSLDARA
mmetsp:Transcript_27207/g.73272  ORF Transcript_27207/g.73272 Transcript_27207/m.73272 type:complete len:296 (+) Transcript_27207:2221-3108(+)